MRGAVAPSTPPPPDHGRSGGRQPGSLWARGGGKNTKTNTSQKADTLNNPWVDKTARAWVDQLPSEAWAPLIYREAERGEWVDGGARPGETNDQAKPTANCCTYQAVKIQRPGIRFDGQGN